MIQELLLPYYGSKGLLSAKKSSLDKKCFYASIKIIYMAYIVGIPAH